MAWEIGIEVHICERRVHLSRSFPKGSSLARAFRAICDQRPLELQRIRGSFAVFDLCSPRVPPIAHLARLEWLALTIMLTWSTVRC